MKVTKTDSASSKPSMVAAVLEHGPSTVLDEDAVLVERFLSGGSEAFDQLYTKYYDKVFSIARGVLLDQDEASDAVQEIFTLVYRHLGRFDRRSRFSTWLFRIAVNRSIQEARRRKHRVRNVELTEIASQKTVDPPEPQDPNIADCLGKLKPADRALLVLFYWEELSLTEIAGMIGTNVNAAKTRLYRAREKFRKLYEANV